MGSTFGARGASWRLRAGAGGGGGAAREEALAARGVTQLEAMERVDTGMAWGNLLASLELGLPKTFAVSGCRGARAATRRNRRFRVSLPNPSNQTTPR